MDARWLVWLMAQSSQRVEPSQSAAARRVGMRLSSNLIAAKSWLVSLSRTKHRVDDLGAGSGEARDALIETDVGTAITGSNLQIVRM